MAAGFELMLGSDIRIAAEHARFGLPQGTRALIPVAASIAHLPRRLAWPLAMELMRTGELLDACRPREIGLVIQVVPALDVLPMARAMAERIARHGHLAVRAIKRAATQSIGRTLAEGFELENAAEFDVLLSRDAREGSRAFVEKRLPSYQGH